MWDFRPVYVPRLYQTPAGAQHAAPERGFQGNVSPPAGESIRRREGERNEAPRQGVVVYTCVCVERVFNVRCPRSLPALGAYIWLYMGGGGCFEKLKREVGPLAERTSSSCSYKKKGQKKRLFANECKKNAKFT